MNWSKHSSLLTVKIFAIYVIFFNDDLFFSRFILRAWPTPRGSGYGWYVSVYTWWSRTTLTLKMLLTLRPRMTSIGGQLRVTWASLQPEAKRARSPPRDRQTTSFGPTGARSGRQEIMRLPIATQTSTHLDPTVSSFLPSSEPEKGATGTPSTSQGQTGFSFRLQLARGTTSISRNQMVSSSLPWYVIISHISSGYIYLALSVALCVITTGKSWTQELNGIVRTHFFHLLPYTKTWETLSYKVSHISYIISLKLLHVLHALS